MIRQITYEQVGRPNVTLLCPVSDAPMVPLTCYMDQDNPFMRFCSHVNQVARHAYLAGFAFGQRAPKASAAVAEDATHRLLTSLGYVRISTDEI